MNETKFIELYTQITECSEGRARSVFILLSDHNASRINFLSTPYRLRPGRRPEAVRSTALIPIDIPHINPVPAFRPSL